MKRDGRVGWNPLKGALDDTLHAVMCGAGHRLRMDHGQAAAFLRPNLDRVAGDADVIGVDGRNSSFRARLKTGLLSAD